MATYNQPNSITKELVGGADGDTDELLGEEGVDLGASSPQGHAQVSSPNAHDEPALPGPPPPKSAKTRRRKTRDVVMNVHVYLNDREAMMARRLQKVYDVPYTIMFRMWLREQYALTFKADIVREAAPIVPGVNDE